MIKTHTISVKSKGHSDIIDITGKIEKLVKENKLKHGSVLVFVAGSTASVSTIEFEPNLVKDVKRIFESLAPYNLDYEHHKTWGDDNGPAHVRSTIMGPSITVPVQDGKLLLGTWQQVVILDFDTRPRNRDVIIQLSGE